MPKLSTERSSRAETLAVVSLTFAALVLLGCVLAYWTWAWLGPRPEPRVAATSEPRVQVVAANRLFGVAPAAAAPAATPIKLLGVAAATTGGRGHAIVQLDSRHPVVARENDEIGPGIRLAEIHPDHVVLERNGARETLAWPVRTPSPAAPPLPARK
jgi:general secretion pathway protein C